MPKNPSSTPPFRGLRSLDPRKLAIKAGAEGAGAIAVNGLILSLSVLEKTAGAIPPPAGSIVKGTLGGLLQVIDIIKVIYAVLISKASSNMTILQTTTQNVDDINQLIDRVKTLELSIFRPLKGKAAPESTIQLVTDFAE